MTIRSLPRFDRYIGIDYSGAETPWLRHADMDGSLTPFLTPSLTPSEQMIAQVEGWILGVR